MDSKNYNKEKVEQIANELNPAEAMNKLNGYFKNNFWNNHLRITIGRLHLKQSDFINAGQMLYFKQNRNESEERAVNRFVESCQRNKLKIFKSLIKPSKTPSGIDIAMSNEIFTLIMSIANQEGSLPKEIVRWICNYQRIRNIEFQKNLLMVDSRDTNNEK